MYAKIQKLNKKMRHSSSRKLNIPLKFLWNKHKDWDEIMKKTLLCLSALFFVGLSGCAVHTPHGSVVVDPDHNHLILINLQEQLRLFLQVLVWNTSRLT